MVVRVTRYTSPEYVYICTHTRSESVMRSFRLWPGPRGLLPVIPEVFVSVTRPKPSPHLLGLLYILHKLSFTTLTLPHSGQTTLCLHY